MEEKLAGLHRRLEPAILLTRKLFTPDPGPLLRGSSQLQCGISLLTDRSQKATDDDLAFLSRATLAASARRAPAANHRCGTQHLRRARPCRCPARGHRETRWTVEGHDLSL